MQSKRHSPTPCCSTGISTTPSCRCSCQCSCTWRTCASSRFSWAFTCALRHYQSGWAAPAHHSGTQGVDSTTTASCLCCNWQKASLALRLQLQVGQPGDMSCCCSVMKLAIGDMSCCCSLMKLAIPRCNVLSSTASDTLPAHTYSWHACTCQGQL